MIVVIDDEPICLDMMRHALEQEGYRVETFESGAEALQFLEKAQPQLIISDIDMPEMTGFEFRSTYQARFHLRRTPFVFLSGRNDAQTMVRGLDQGVDDYLVKPLHPEVIRARVRSLLKRRADIVSQVFHGNLGLFPFINVMRFCEMKHLTGCVDVRLADFNARFLFQGGELQLDGSQANENFEQVLDLAEGTFTIFVQPFDYDELIDVSVFPDQETQPRERAEVDKPMGKLSGVQVKNRLFQLQTEYADRPDHAVVTVVILDGRVVSKTSQPVSTIATKVEIQQRIEAQHLQVEKELHGKLTQVAEQKQQPQDSPREKFYQLFEAGFEKYRGRDYSTALQLWEQAAELDPEDKTLASNLTIVRNKLAQ